MGKHVVDSDASDPFSIRIGTAPVNWNNFDLNNWRPTVPYPAILDEMKAAGYTATEWDASFGGDLGILRQEIFQRDMSYTGAYRWLDFLHHAAFTRDLADLGPFLDVLTGIGANHLIVADRLRPERVACAGAVPSDGSRSIDGDGFATIAHNVTRLAEHVAPLGLRVHYHNHAGTYVETPAEVGALATRLEGTPVDFCFDTGHYAYGGGDARAFLSDHVTSIGYLHLKDVNASVLAEARQQGWSFLDALRHIIFCPLGEGQADIPAIVATLVDNRFDGWVIVEQDTCEGDSTANARANLDTFLALAAS